MRDLVVVGGGPVGLALALALSGSGLRVEVLDPRAPGGSARDDRMLALSHGSHLVLAKIGVWSRLEAQPGAATPIAAVDISQREGFGAVRLDAGEEGVPALGYVVSYRALQSALDEAAAARGVAVRFGTRAAAVRATPAYAVIELVPAAGAVSAAGDVPAGTAPAGIADEPLVTRLAVVADGGADALPGIRRYRHDYAQSAVVATVACARPHGGVAYERFTPDGPVALLPCGRDMALVWTVPPARAEQLLALGPQEFLDALQRHVGERVRGFTAVRDRRAFPLALQFAADTVGERVVVIGNAAQTLHPVAGQGFNLGLRDAWELGCELLDCAPEAIGDRPVLARYARRRRLDRYAGIGFTHALAGVFVSRAPWVEAPRGLALALLDSLPPVKRAFTRSMLFGLR
jgi:2-octaprenyl-6-methoxyphenol hydroxylase